MFSELCVKVIAHPSILIVYIHEHWLTSPPGEVKPAYLLKKFFLTSSGLSLLGQLKSLRISYF